MSANENEVLTDMEPYRDAYQILLEYEEDDDEFDYARRRLCDELEKDIDVGRMDRFHCLQMVNDGKVEESLDYLRDQVLEE